MEAIDEAHPPEGKFFPQTIFLLSNWKLFVRFIKGIRIVTENVTMPQEKLPIFLSRLFLNNAIMNSTEFSCKASNNEEDESEDHISLQVFGIISLVMLKK